MIYVTSDWHFNHSRAFIYEPRGFSSVEEMNEAIIERHNSLVNIDDDVYVLGDLCLGGCEPDIMARNQALIEKMNGRLHVICGNHCTPTRQQMYKLCNNVVEVVYATILKYKGYHFYLSHFPTMTANLEKETLKQCTICLYGHTHQKDNFYQDIPFLYHVGCDSHDCYPVLLDDAIEEMRAKVKECFDQIQILPTAPKQRCEKCVYEFKCADSYFDRRCERYKRDPPDGGYYG